MTAVWFGTVQIIAVSGQIRADGRVFIAVARARVRIPVEDHRANSSPAGITLQSDTLQFRFCLLYTRRRKKRRSAWRRPFHAMRISPFRSLFFCFSHRNHHRQTPYCVVKILGKQMIASVMIKGRKYAPFYYVKFLIIFY